MSLKAFHLFFIVASTLLSAGLGGWAVSQYQVAPEGWLLGLAISSFAVTAGLVAYLPWFIRKYRAFSYLSLAALVGLGLTASQSAFACSVCFGNPASPLVKSANAGIWFLMMVIGSVLLAFVGLFAFWWFRARAQRPSGPTKLAA
jgi:hypothetical protein